MAWAGMGGMGAWTGMDHGWHGVTTMASPLYSVVDRMKKVQAVPLLPSCVKHAYFALFH
jgi:hypothetical protein